MNTQTNFSRGAHTLSHCVTHNLQKLTIGPQKWDAEVLPLPGADSTIQTSQRLEQKSHMDSP